jgi:hypothetical protein
MKNNTVSGRYRVLLMLMVLGMATGVLPNLVSPGTAQAQLAFVPTTLNDPTPQPNAAYGSAVSGAGDLDGDGVPDVLIGAPNQAVGANANQGQAFVISGATGLLLHTLNDPTPQANASFGQEVAGLGDVDGDGVPDILVGAPSQDVGANANQGQAFVFSGATGLLLRTLDDPTPQVFAAFGARVAGLGDVNSDGVPDLLVGAHLQNVGANGQQGQAFVFSGATGLLLRTLNDPTPQVAAFFGNPLSGLGDVDGDGVPDILVGANDQDVGANAQQGQAFVFSGATGLLLYRVEDPVPQAGAQFGAAASGLGDVNADGVPDLLIGAPSQNVGANQAQGRAYVMSGKTGLLLVTLNNPGPQAGGRFGQSVAGPGDMNGDRVPDLLVGAFFQDVGANLNQGQAFLFMSPRLGRFAVFDPQVAITLRPGLDDDRFKLTARVALGKISNGIQPVREKVTLRIGSFTTTIPARSFVATPSGFRFAGSVGGTPLRVVIRRTGATSFRLTATDRGVDFSGTRRRVPVTLRIGNDSRSKTVKAAITQLRR